MADAKITALTEVTSLETTDILAVVDDPGGTPVTKKATVANIVKGAIDYLPQSYSDQGDTGASVTLDLANGVYQEHDLSANVNFTTPSISAGETWELTLILVQDATGNRTVSINSMDVSEHISDLPFSRSMLRLVLTPTDEYIYPADVNTGAVVYADFVNQEYSIQGKDKAVNGFLNTTRNERSYYVDASVVATGFDLHMPRVGSLGLLVEEARTNVALHNRDLANAAWTKSNVTATKNQAGIDGVSNSASSITATAGNGTCLQSITLSSSARFQTAYVKRLVGTGTIEMTMDGGSTWTAIIVTAGWTRVSIPTQTLANPNVGFRIVTSGDSIAVDFVQNENGIFETSPILTTSASNARPQDDITLVDFDKINLTTGTLVAIGTCNAGAGAALNAFVSLDNDATTERHQIRQEAANCRYIVVDGGGVTSNIQVSGAAGSRRVLTARFQENEFDFNLDGTDGTTDNSGTLPTPTQMQIGFGAGLTYLNGLIEKIIVFDRVLTDAEVAGIAAL